MSSLQFICGASGSGKSTWLFQHVVQLSERKPEQNFLILVPEQFTMATQKELVSRYPGHSIMNIDVLSFKRLAFRVFDDLGMQELSVLEETGKNLVLRKVAQEKEDELRLLGGSLKRMGYISELKSLISEFMQYQVTPEVLRTLLPEETETLFDCKLQDILTVYEGFCAQLEGSYITAEEILERLIEVAPDSALLKDSVIVFDGFTGFTPIQLRLLSEMFPLVSEILVTVTADSDAELLKKPELTDLFYMSEKMTHVLLRIAEETGTTLLPPVLLGDAFGKRYKEKGQLWALERRLFRTPGGAAPGRKKRQEADIPSDALTQQIFLASLPDPREELTYAVSEIRRMVRTQQMRYRDFAIVSGDLETYANYADEVFRAFDVPVFIDRTKTILFSPLTEMLRALLSILTEHYSAESIFYYLRTGLSGMSREDVDRLENYVLARGIRGKRFKERFAILPEKGTEEDLAELNRLRDGLMAELAPLEEAFAAPDRTAEKECRAVYDFLLSHGIKEKLLADAARFTEAGRPEKAREFEEIYGIVADLLGKIAEVLPEEPLSAEEFAEILNAGFEAADIGLIPPGYDRVTLGDIERTRLPEIRVLFFLGVNDGVIPGSLTGGGIISELERERFQNAGIELAPSARERAFIQKFYLYMNLTKPSERLVLTCSRVDSGGASRRPSYLLGTIRKLFPELSMTEPAREEYLLETPESAKALLIDGFRRARQGERDPEWEALLSWYRTTESYRDFAERMTEAAFMLHRPERLQRETAKKLYGAVLKNSVTRLERYASCAFSHFLRYGLSLSERDMHEFQAPDLGNVYHDALERYGKKLAAEGRSWVQTDTADAYRLSDEALSEAVLSSACGDFFSDAKGTFDYGRMQRILRRSVVVMSEQLRAGRFTPEAYEIAFGGKERVRAAEFSLSGEEKMILSGRIDRVDTLENGDELYVKVIDYKSGGTHFDLPQIYEGLQLQLVVYLAVAEELMGERHAGKTIHPGGIFYYHLADPILKEEELLSDDEVQSKILKELRPDGVMNADGDAVAGMDMHFADPEFTGASEVIRAKRKKDGGFDSTSRVLTEEELRLLSAHTEKKMVGLGQEILSGKIEAAPYRMRERTACEYCSYRGICGFDERLGFSYREIPERSRDEVLEAMKTEVDA